MTIIGHGFGGKKATVISHGYGSLAAGIVLYREIWNDIPVTDSIYKPMAVSAGSEKFDGG